METGRRASGWLLGSALIALVGLACGPEAASDTQTYRDPDERFLFKLPADWNVYTEELEAVATRPFNGTNPEVSGVFFDGYPNEDAQHLAVSVAEAQFPIGTAAVRPIDDQERDYISRFLLAQTVLPYQEQEEVREMLKQDFEFADEVEGVRVFVSYRERETDELAVVFLKSVTNADDTRMYSIAVGCSLECFQAYEQDIEEVVESWIINTRD
jgi:hypothetical protein